MQINSSKIGEWVEDPQGNKFRIQGDVRTDWKANARAGVAILAKEYTLAEFEQGAVSSPQDRAQQTYSAYNGGHGNRDRYLHERRDGLPHHRNDRHFLQDYFDERKRR
jgi:broad specificity phosphatase PhoE